MNSVRSKSWGRKWKSWGWVGGGQSLSRLTSSRGTGCFSLLTKKTPLFLRALGQSVWMMRWPAVFWEITIDCGSSLSRKACAQKRANFDAYLLLCGGSHASTSDAIQMFSREKELHTIINSDLQILPLFIVHHNLVPFVNLQSHRLQSEILKKLHPPIPLLLSLSPFLAHLQRFSTDLRFFTLCFGGPIALGALTWAPNPEGQIDGPQIAGILVNYWHNFQNEPRKADIECIGQHNPPETCLC